MDLSSKLWSFMRKNNCLLSEHSWDLKKLLQKKIECCYNAAIHINFPHHLYSHQPSGPVGARSSFRWKLHPSSQAWPLLSTSNRGETAIAKCGNWPQFKMSFDTHDMHVTFCTHEDKQTCTRENNCSSRTIWDDCVWDLYERNQARGKQNTGVKNAQKPGQSLFLWKIPSQCILRRARKEKC